MDWEFWIGDVGIPLVTFLVGLFAGKNWNKYSKIIAKSIIKGNGNTVAQNSKIKK